MPAENSHYMTECNLGPCSACRDAEPVDQKLESLFERRRQLWSIRNTFMTVLSFDYHLNLPLGSLSVACLRRMSKSPALISIALNSY